MEDNDDIDSYRLKKIKILSTEFLINLSAEQVHHLYELDTEIAIDNAARKIIMDYYN